MVFPGSNNPPPFFPGVYPSTPGQYPEGYIPAEPAPTPKPTSKVIPQEGAAMTIPILASLQGALALKVTTLTFTPPAGLSSGDLAIILYHNNDGTVVPNEVAGWTKQSINQAPSGTLAVYSKIAGPSEGNVVITAAFQTEHVGWWLRITGAAATTPISEIDLRIGSFGPSHEVTTPTTTLNDNLGIVFFGTTGALVPFSTSNTGWVEDAILFVGSGEDTGGDSSVLATKSQTGSGPLESVTITPVRSSVPMTAAIVIASEDIVPPVTFDSIEEWLFSKDLQGTYNDRLQQFLTEKGYGPNVTDSFYTYLGDNGFTGAFTERLSKSISSGFLFAQ